MATYGARYVSCVPFADRTVGVFQIGLQCHEAATFLALACRLKKPIAAKTDI